MQSARDDLPPWLAFERRIFVKQNAADVLRKVLRHRIGEASRASQGETIVIGTATDPFPAGRAAISHHAIGARGPQPITRGLSICIITKSPLVTRDIDVLRRINRISSLSVHLSLITLDRELARRLEPRAPRPKPACAPSLGCARTIIETGINVMPVLPAITDHPDQLERLVQTVAANESILRQRLRAASALLGACSLPAVHRAGSFRISQSGTTRRTRMIITSARLQHRARETMRALCGSTAWRTDTSSRSGRSEAALRDTRSNASPMSSWRSSSSRHP